MNYKSFESNKLKSNTNEERVTTAFDSAKPSGAQRQG